jgi:hypothetical protein
MRGAFTAWMRPEPLEAHALALPLIVLLAGSVAKGRGGFAKTCLQKRTQALIRSETFGGK